MKIAILSEGIWPLHLGGIQKQVYAYAKAMSAHAEVHIYYAQEADKTYPNEMLPGVKLIPLRYPFKSSGFPGHLGQEVSPEDQTRRGRR